MKNETQLNTEIKTENQSYIVLPTFLLKNLDLTAMELIFLSMVPCLPIMMPLWLAFSQ